MRYMVRYSFRGRPYSEKGILAEKDARDFVIKINGQKVERRLFPERRAGATVLTDYAEQWLKDCTLRLKHNTLRSYRMNLRTHVLPELGHLRLTDISRRDVKTLILKKQRAGLAPHSLRLIVAPLSKLFSDAIEEELVQANPCLRPSKMAVVRGSRRRIDPFTQREQTRILTTAERVTPTAYPFILTLFRAGLRSGEAVALERRDVDLKHRAFQITKNFTNGRLEGSTKDKDPRTVDMSAQLAAVLRRHLASHTRKLVFPNTVGGYLDMTNWTERVWGPILRKAHVRRRAPHHCRHTYATRLLEHNESLAYLQQQLGHSSIDVTMRNYGHLLPSRDRTAVDRLDDRVQVQVQVGRKSGVSRRAKTLRN